MFSLGNQVELRRVTISCIITCIYLPALISVLVYRGVLYTVGSASSAYILFMLFTAELLKSFYLKSASDIQSKKSKPTKNRAGDIVKSFGFLLAVIFCYFAGIILFGAPFLDNHEETLMLSTLLTLLTVFPLVAQSGIETSMQLLFGVKSYAKDTVVDMLICNALLTLCGSWMGAVVIPLDWQTPWQVWPIPCYLGALGGYFLANALMLVKVSLMNAGGSLHFLVNIINKLHISK